MIQMNNDNKMVVEEAEVSTFGEPLSEFLQQLENYTPTIPDAVISHYLRTSGCDSKDPRLIRLISVAAQKFISDIGNDALQHCKTRSHNVSSSHGSSKNAKGAKDRRFCLTMDDLTPALAEYGIIVKKPHYYV